LSGRIHRRADRVNQALELAQAVSGGGQASTPKLNSFNEQIFPNEKARRLPGTP
jgi:hypothetical protein